MPAVPRSRALAEGNRRASGNYAQAAPILSQRTECIGGTWRYGVESWIIRVARGAAPIEGVGLRRVEDRAGKKACGQVGVGEEELAEGDGVGSACIQRLLGALVGEALVADVDTTEGGLELRADTVGAYVFPGADEGDLAAAELASDIAEGGCAVRITHRVGISARGEVYAYSAGTPYGYGRVRGLQEQPRAILHWAAVVVIALIAAVLQKLI